MATLEAAAEQLLVKLRGLDSEIEESERKLETLTGRVEGVARDVGKDWTSVADAAASLLDRLRDEHARLHTQELQTAQAVNEAHGALSEAAAQARVEAGEGRAGIESVARHASALESDIDSLAAEAAEAPARSLAERLQELQHELGQLVEEARDFVRDDVTPAAEQVADEMREACEDVRRRLVDETAAALQEAFDEWDSKMAGLEDYVMTQGYKASHQHASDVVEYAVEECDKASRRHLDDLQQLIAVLLEQLELAAEVGESSRALVTKAGAELLQGVEETRSSSANAVAALDRVKQQLASLSFVGV